MLGIIKAPGRRWEAGHLLSWAFVEGGCFVSFSLPVLLGEKHLQGLYQLGWEVSSLCCSCCLLHTTWSIFAAWSP